MKAEDADINLHHMLSSGDGQPRKEVELVLGDFPYKESPIVFKKHLFHIKTEYHCHQIHFAKTQAEEELDHSYP